MVFLLRGVKKRPAFVFYFRRVFVAGLSSPKGTEKPRHERAERATQKIEKDSEQSAPTIAPTTVKQRPILINPSVFHTLPYGGLDQVLQASRPHAVRLFATMAVAAKSFANRQWRGGDILLLL